MTLPRKILIFGNSGAGKSTLAIRYAVDHGLFHLDLDTLAWENGDDLIRRPILDSVNDITAFASRHDSFVIEGCYTSLLAGAAGHANEIIFLNPGIEVCVARCRARPFEPHKYESKEAQDRDLPMLLDWVRAYETRTDEFSLKAHRDFFDAFVGTKTEITGDPGVSEASHA